MKRILWAVWLLSPVAVAAYHYGPGQQRLVLDAAADELAAATAHAEAARAAGDDDAARSEWARAIESLEAAQRLLPVERVAEARRLRIELAQAKTHVGRLPEARSELEALVDELENDPGADPGSVADARGALASAQYYMTWLERLEGAPRSQWEASIESSRQHYRWLAERAADAHDEAALAEQLRNLESAVRLARMDLDELQGLPLPSQ